MSSVVDSVLVVDWCCGLMCVDVFIWDGVAMTLGSCRETHHVAPLDVTLQCRTGCVARTEGPLLSFRLVLIV